LRRTPMPMSSMKAFHTVLEIRAEAPSTNTSNDQNIGSAREGSPSLSGLISTLVPTLIIAGIYFALFILLRSRFPRQYAPRTYLGALRPQERTPAPPNTLFGWIPFMKKVGEMPRLKRSIVPDNNTNISSQTSTFCNTILWMAIFCCDTSRCPSLFALSVAASHGRFYSRSMRQVAEDRNS